MAQKRRASPGADEQESSDLDVFQSQPIEDRSSKFIAYYSPSMKATELQKLHSAASASHKILAWRRESNQQSITKAIQYVSGSDDDGEKFAGKRVEKVMNAMQVTGACVVARWYGGVMLGPVRFNHIEACAQGAIKEWQAQKTEIQAKRRKVEDDRVEQARLARVLTERDQSIDVLRTLASEKENMAKAASQATVESSLSVQGKASSQPEPTTTNRVTRPDYTKMPLASLQALERARDASIAFLLKRIDQAEARIAAAPKGTSDQARAE